MANYTLTAFSKDAQAVQFGAQQSTKYSNYKANLAGRSAQQGYLREIEKNYVAQQREADRIALQQRKEIESQNVFIRGISTLGDVVADVFTGAVKALEGIVDLGAGLVGAVGGIFSSDFANNVQNFISTDYTTTYIGNPLEELTKYSYTNDGKVGEWIEGAASGVGQMLPAIVLTIATSGAYSAAAAGQVASGAATAAQVASAAAKAGQIAGTIAFGVSAAGMSQEEAYQNGADYYAGFGYGLLSGALETAIEAISGGASKYFMGAGMIDKVVDKVFAESAKNLALKKGLSYAVDVLGEGVEEVISEAITPYLKRITYDPNAEGATIEDLLTAGVIGSLTAIGMGGSNAVVKKINKSYGANTTISEGLSDINVLTEKKNNLWANSKLDEKTALNIDETIAKTKQKMSDALQRVKPTKRQSIIENYRDYGITNIFNEDGTLKDTLSDGTYKNETEQNITSNPEIIKGNENIQEEVKEDENIQINNIASESIKYNKDAYSLDLQGKENNLQFKPTTNDLSIEQKKAKQQFSKLNKGLRQAKIVFTDELGTDSEGNVREGAYHDGVLYINTKTNAIKTVTLHELTHWAENTKEYQKFANYIIQEAESNLSLPEEFQNLKKVFKDTSEAYEATLTEKYQDELKSQDLAVRQEALKKAQNEILSEIVAKYSSEYLFTNEEAIKRLARTNKTFFSKIVQWIKDKIAVLKGKTTQERETIKFLRNAEELYRKALENAWGANYEGFKSKPKNSIRKTLVKKDNEGRELSKEQQSFFKDSKVVDNNGNLLKVYHGSKSSNFNIFNKEQISKWNMFGSGFYFTSSNEKAKRYAKEELFTNFINLKNPFVSNNKEHLEKLYKKIGKSESDIESYSEKEGIGGSDFFKICYYLEDNGLDVSKVIKELGFDGTIVNGYEDKEIVAFESNQIKNTDNKKPTTSPDIRYSIKKDSEGEYLSEKQQEYFKNTKVLDEDGNLLEVYHGTVSGEFNVFDASFSSVESDMGAGFYFSNSYEDVMSNYEDGGQDFEGKISRLAEKISSEEDIDYDKAEEKARAQLYKKPKRFDVYLNMENPAYVGGALDSPTYLMSEFNENWNIEDFESEEEYYEQVDSDFQEFVDSVIFEAENEGIYDFDGLQDILFDCYSNGGVTINDLKSMLNEKIFASDEEGNLATNELLRIVIEKLGYDGIIDNSPVDKWGFNSGRSEYMEGLDENTRHYIVFKSNQIKLSSNKSPSSSQDIRYSISKTLYTKTKANLSREKVYDKQEAEKVINNIIEKVFIFNENQYGNISSKTREEVIDKLFEALNTRNEGYRSGVALDIAEYLIENAFVENMYDTKDDDIWIIDSMKEFIHGMDLSGIKGEIKYHYDKDNSPYAIWGARKDRHGQAPDQAAQVLEEYGIQIRSNNKADIFFEMDEMYRGAVARLKKKVKESIASVFGEDKKNEIRQEIAREVLLAYDENGRKTKFANAIEKYTNKIASLTKALRTSKEYQKAINNLVTSQSKAKEIVRRKYQDNVKLENDAIKNIVGVVANFTTAKGNLTKDVRKKVEALKGIYTEENILFDSDNFLGENDFGGEIDTDIIDAINEISSGDGDLSARDVILLHKITKGILHLYTTYDKVFKDGKYVETSSYAERYMEQANEVVKQTEDSKISKILSSKVLTSIVDPHSVMRIFDGYRKTYNEQTKQWEDVGFHTETLKEISDGEVLANVTELSLMEKFKDFFKKNKKFEKTLDNKTISIDCQRVLESALEDTKLDISLDDTIKLILYSKREQANLFESGFTIEKDGKIRRYLITPETIQKLQDSLTEQEKAFMKLVNVFFNEDAKKFKVETDEKLFGYAKIEDGNNYIPIVRESSSFVKDISSGVTAKDIITLNNLSMNKDTIQGANAALRLVPLMTLVKSHAHGVSVYYGMAIPFKNFNRIYNKKMGEGVFKRSIRQIDTSNNKGVETYLRKYLNDIQGFRVDTTLLSKVVRRLRKSYATYQLGFNLKTIIGQPSSYWLAHNYIDLDSLFKGVFMKNSSRETMYKYCPFTEYRMEDNAVVKAQGVMDSVSAIADVTTAGIQFMDNQTVIKLWNACQLQIQKTNDLKVGTEENLKLAGALLEKVVRETQSNSIVSEKTGLSRHQNELIASLTMFSSDAQKQLSRIIDAFGALAYSKNRIKNGTMDKNSAEYKYYKKQLPKAVTGYMIATTQYVLIGMLIKWLLNKDDDEDDFVKSFAADFATQIMGLFPVVRDIYGYVSEGYEINNYAYEMLNNLVDATKSLLKMSGDIMSGKDLTKNEIGKPIRDITYAIGQMLGIPVRNMYNYTYGIVEKFDASTAYEMNSLFYETKKSDLSEAIQKGDSKLATTILENLFGGKKLEINSALAKEIVSIYEEGEEFMPTAIKDSVSYEGVTYALNASQKRKFASIYNKAGDVCSDLVKDVLYKNLNAEVRANILSAIYKYYHNLALEDLLGVEVVDNVDKFFAETFGVGNLFLYIKTAKSFEMSIDSKGNFISGSKKKQVQNYINKLKLSAVEKYMLMGYLGYSNEYGRQIVKSYIQRQRLTREEKEELLAASGY